MNGSQSKFFPKVELGMCPKFTTKDSYTCLSRSRSHNGPTNPRSKPQTIQKRKRNTRSKGLSSSARHQADGPRVTDGRSEKESRPSSSAPRITDGPRPILGWSASNWCRGDGPRRPGGQSAKLLPARNSCPNGSK
jgi:hypothetical protein